MKRTPMQICGADARVRVEPDARGACWVYVSAPEASPNAPLASFKLRPADAEALGRALLAMAAPEATAA
jgi:hypothetical protein